MRTPKLPEIPAEEEAPRRNEEKGEKEKDEKAGFLNATPANPPRKNNGDEDLDEFEALAKRFEELKKR